MRAEDKRSVFRVGVFLIVALGLLLMTVFILGQERNLFQKSVRLNTHFENVNGLVEGSIVMVSGLNVGQVTKIEFPGERDLSKVPNAKAISKRMVVELLIGRDALKQIRSDSEAVVGTIGLLGDKIVDITLGSPEAQALEDGAWIQPSNAGGIAGVMTQAEAAVAELTAATQQTQAILKSFEEAGGGASLARMIDSVADLGAAINKEDGLFHQLIYSKDGKEQYNMLMNDVHVALSTGTKTLKDLDTLLNKVRSSESLVNELLFGNEGKDTLAKVNALVSDLNKTMGDASGQEGTLLHALLYDQEGAETLNDAQEAVKDLKITMSEMKSIVAAIDEGQGSLGALIKDPSVYEDLKLLLGNAQRNVVLRTLVRYAVARGEAKPKAN